MCDFSELPEPGIELTELLSWPCVSYMYKKQNTIMFGQIIMHMIIQLKNSPTLSHSSSLFTTMRWKRTTLMNGKIESKYKFYEISEEMGLKLLYNIDLLYCLYPKQGRNCSFTLVTVILFLLTILNKKNTIKKPDN